MARDFSRRRRGPEVSRRTAGAFTFPERLDGARGIHARSFDNSHETESNVAARRASARVPIGCPQVCRVAEPGSAPRQMILTRRPALRINLSALRVIIVDPIRVNPIRDPLGDVAAHIVKAPEIRQYLPDRMRSAGAARE